MPLETATYIHDLVPANPAHTDAVNQGDSHLRLLKNVLQSQFPNFGSAAMTAKDTALSKVGTDGNSGAPAVGYDADATAGFYRSATGQQTIVGQLFGNGAKEVGELCMFPFVPATMGVGGGSQAGKLYLECDGSTNYLVAQYPKLAAILGTTYGGDGVTTFGVPNLKDTGRFPRSRTGSVAVGTSQSNQNASHTHTLTDPGHTHTVTDPGHAHSITDPGHSHTVPQDFTATGGSHTVPGASSGTDNFDTPTSTATTGITIQSHTTGITNATNTTGITLSTDGGSEARPESFVVVFAVKT